MGDSGHFLFPSAAVPRPWPARRGTHAAPLPRKRSADPWKPGERARRRRQLPREEDSLFLCLTLCVSDFLSLTFYFFCLCLSRCISVCLSQSLTLFLSSRLLVYVSYFSTCDFFLSHFSWFTTTGGGAIPIRRHREPLTCFAFLPLANAPLA